MNKFDESKLDRMNPYSRQYQDQFDRILYGGPKPKEDESIFRKVINVKDKRTSEERRIRRAMWRMQG